MSDQLPLVYLVRHGETAWSRSGQHTGLTDLPLTAIGEQQALRLGELLKGRHFDSVISSGSQRANRTCELAGFRDRATIDSDLNEWDYGAFEGKTTVEILAKHPDWQLFRDGCPGGESPQQVAERADRTLQRIRAVQGNVLIFSSGHILRVLTARWLGLAPAGGELFVLSTASLSLLGYEHNLSEPVIRLWNQVEFS